MELKDIETLLADKPDALEFVRGIHTHAALLTPEIEAELPKFAELKVSRETLADILAKTGAKDHAALLTDFAAIKTAKAGLEEKLAAIKSGKETPEQLALKEQIVNLDKSLKEIKEENRLAKEGETRAQAEKKQTDLESSIIAAAAKGNVERPDELYILLKGKGMAGIGDDGKPFFRKLNDKGELVKVDNVDAVIKHLEETRKDLFKGSGIRGKDLNHKGRVNDEKVIPNSHAEAVTAFLHA